MVTPFPRFLRPVIGTLTGLALVAGACTSDSEVAELSLETVLTANLEAGMSDDVAQCFVGIGSKELDAALLMPGAERSPADAALVDQLTASCEEASAFVLDEPIEPDTLAFDDEPFTLGDDPAFDLLWEACEVGDGAACDELWEKAPIGSEYERFGVTCGDRSQLIDCAIELTEETVEEIDSAAEAKAEAQSARSGSSESEDQPS